MTTDGPRDDQAPPPNAGGAEPYRPEPAPPVHVPPVPVRPEPQRPAPAVEPPGTPQPVAPPRAEPPARPPTDLDEFLARAVDRQIAEQRALREALEELTNAVRELQARPAVASSPAPSLDLAEMEARISRAVSSSGPAIDPAQLEARIARAVASARPPIDPAEIEARIARAVSSNNEALMNELRELRSTVVPGVQRATEASSVGSRAIEHDMSILRDAVGGLSADVEGIAQALIDLNAGLRDWADGIDRNIEVVVDTVQQARDVAAKVERLQVEAIELAERREAESRPLLPVEAEVVEAIVPPPPVVVPAPEITTEIEQRVKETMELSLYLADQIEAFDKAISNLGDLPARLEGVITQALKRTLAARAKLDRDAELALDEAVATLDEHVATIGDLSTIAQTQARVEAALAALTEAVDRSSDDDLPPAGGALTKGARGARKSSRSTPKAAVGKPGPRKAQTGTSRAKPKAAKRSAPKRKRKPPATDYLSLDADPNLPDGD